MCGIFATINDASQPINVIDRFKLLQHRGPDFSALKKIDESVTLGFHRLAVVDPHPESNQPLRLDDTWLICNGEIFNHAELEEKYGFEMQTKSDCEVILHLYKHFGGWKSAIHRLLPMLRAEFAFVLYDRGLGTTFAARDPFGVRPLFWGHDAATYWFSSELKAVNFGNSVQFPPASFITFHKGHEVTKYHTIYNETHEYLPVSRQVIKNDINTLLRDAVKIRLMSDRPVGCFLSGGLDSSLITAIVHEHLPDVHCFSIGLSGGADIAAAKKVAAFLGVKNHHIVTFTVEEGFNALSAVIWHLETYDITTIRASIPQYLLSKYISENTDVKVLFSGEGADELFCGYQYSKLAPTYAHLEDDSRRLLEELHMFDNLRVDRTTAAFGLEVRIPFLDAATCRHVANSLRRICDITFSILICSKVYSTKATCVTYKSFIRRTIPVSFKFHVFSLRTLVRRNPSFLGSFPHKYNRIIDVASFKSHTSSVLKHMWNVIIYTAHPAKRLTISFVLDACFVF